jgi:hypothetical protein
MLNHGIPGYRRLHGRRKSRPPQHRIGRRSQHPQLGGWGQTLDPGQRSPELSSQLVQRRKARGLLRLLKLPHSADAGNLNRGVIVFCERESYKKTISFF